MPSPGPQVVRQERVLPTPHLVPHLRPAQVVLDRMEVQMHWAIRMVPDRLAPEERDPCNPQCSGLQPETQVRDQESRPR